MKARIKGTNDPFREIYTIEIKGVNGLYSPDDIEFEQEPTSDHWQDVRERAAIAAMHAFCVSPSSYTGNIPLDKMAQRVVEIADALVKKLKGE